MKRNRERFFFVELTNSILVRYNCLATAIVPSGGAYALERHPSITARANTKKD